MKKQLLLKPIFNVGLTTFQDNYPVRTLHVGQNLFITVEKEMLMQFIVHANDCKMLLVIINIVHVNLPYACRQYLFHGCCSNIIQCFGKLCPSSFLPGYSNSLSWREKVRKMSSVCRFQHASGGFFYTVTIFGFIKHVVTK